MQAPTADSNRSRNTTRGIGLTVALPIDVVVAAAIATQENGYISFWLNNPPGTDGLGALNAVAQHTTIRLGVGVIPLSAHDPAEIVRRVRQTNLAQDRLYLGIGSGSGSGGVERVTRGIRDLRSELSCQVVVAALGQMMCRLAGTEADGVLFNWLTPDHATRSIEWVRQGANSAGRPMPRLMAYVRVSLGPEADRALQREASNYEAIPQYAAHFTRMGIPAIQTTIAGESAEDVEYGLADWDGIVDEVILRVITANNTVDEVVRLVEAASPARSVSGS